MKHSMVKWAVNTAAMAALLMGGAAQAEVLPTSGVYPANSDAAIAIDTIAINQLEGTQGSAQRFVLRERLEAAEIQGQPWLRILSSHADGAQAIIKGSVGHDTVRDELDDKEVKSCLEKDSDDKCIRHRRTYIPCHKLTVRLYPDLVMVDEKGEEMLNFASRITRTEEYCEDDDAIPTTSGVLELLNKDLAWDIRRDLAPMTVSRDIRILERRKGLVKQDRNVFKDAVRMTKNDALASCIGFEGLEERNPEHGSLLFNIGLCKEGAGELDAAEGYYTRAQAVMGEKSYLDEAFKRTRLFREGALQLQQRGAAFAGTDEPGPS